MKQGQLTFADEGLWRKKTKENIETMPGFPSCSDTTSKHANTQHVTLLFQVDKVLVNQLKASYLHVHT